MVFKCHDFVCERPHPSPTHSSKHFCLAAALVGEGIHPPSSRAHVFTDRIFIKRPTVSLPSSNFQMRAFLVASLVLVASIVTPVLSTHLGYAVVPQLSKLSTDRS